MLKELNKVWLQARRQAAAWQRWHRKRPHNRTRRPCIRDDQGRVIGHGPSTPLPEPALHPAFTRKVTLPSGRIDVVVSDGHVEEAYRLARYPKPLATEVRELPIAEAEIRRRYAALCAS